MNDCFEIFVIIVQVSQDIHDWWEEGLTLEFSMPWFSLRNITY